MTFTKKEPMPVEAAFGVTKQELEEGVQPETLRQPEAKKPPVSIATQVFAPFNAVKAEENDDLCIVLHGYGRLGAAIEHYIDNYKFVGGVGRNIPRIVANAWAKGKRWQDDKPAASRVYLQAILPVNATEVDFAKATGIQPMPASKLAAMIGATDARQLVEAMGAQQALAFAEELRKQVSQ